jgi:hypothetical protein
MKRNPERDSEGDKLALWGRMSGCRQPIRGQTRPRAALRPMSQREIYPGIHSTSVGIAMALLSRLSCELPRPPEDDRWPSLELKTSI